MHMDYGAQEKLVRVCLSRNPLVIVSRSLPLSVDKRTTKLDKLAAPLGSFGPWFRISPPKLMRIGTDAGLALGWKTKDL
jgi:hypothetical protein